MINKNILIIFILLILIYQFCLKKNLNEHFHLHLPHIPSPPNYKKVINRITSVVSKPIQHGKVISKIKPSTVKTVLNKSWNKVKYVASHPMQDIKTIGNAAKNLEKAVSSINENELNSIFSKFSKEAADKIKNSHDKFLKAWTNRFKSCDDVMSYMNNFSKNIDNYLKKDMENNGKFFKKYGETVGKDISNFVKCWANPCFWILDIGCWTAIDLIFGAFTALITNVDGTDEEDDAEVNATFLLLCESLKYGLDEEEEGMVASLTLKYVIADTLIWTMLTGIINALIVPILAPPILVAVYMVTGSSNKQIADDISYSLCDLIAVVVATQIVNMALGEVAIFDLSFWVTTFISGLMCTGSWLGVEISSVIPGFVPILPQLIGSSTNCRVTHDRYRPQDTNMNNDNSGSNRNNENSSSNRNTDTSQVKFLGDNNVKSSSYSNLEVTPDSSSMIYFLKEQRKYKKINNGNCESNDMVTINDINNCSTAGLDVDGIKNYDNDMPQNGYNYGFSHPKGCIYDSKSKSLRFNKTGLSLCNDENLCYCLNKRPKELYSKLGPGLDSCTIIGLNPIKNADECNKAARNLGFNSIDASQPKGYSSTLGAGYKEISNTGIDSPSDCWIDPITKRAHYTPNKEGKCGTGGKDCLCRNFSLSAYKNDNYNLPLKDYKKDAIVNKRPKNVYQYSRNFAITDFDNCSNNNLGILKNELECRLAAKQFNLKYNGSIKNFDSKLKGCIYNSEDKSISYNENCICEFPSDRPKIIKNNKCENQNYYSIENKPTCDFYMKRVNALEYQKDMPKEGYVHNLGRPNGCALHNNSNKASYFVDSKEGNCGSNGFNCICSSNPLNEIVSSGKCEDKGLETIKTKNECDKAIENLGLPGYQDDMPYGGFIGGKGVGRPIGCALHALTDNPDSKASFFEGIGDWECGDNDFNCICSIPEEKKLKQVKKVKCSNKSSDQCYDSLSIQKKLSFNSKMICKNPYMKEEPIFKIYTLDPDGNKWYLNIPFSENMESISSEQVVKQTPKDLLIETIFSDSLTGNYVNDTNKGNLFSLVKNKNRILITTYQNYGQYILLFFQAENLVNLNSKMLDFLSSDKVSKEIDLYSGGFNINNKFKFKDGIELLNTKYEKVGYSKFWPNSCNFVTSNTHAEDRHINNLCNNQFSNDTNKNSFKYKLYIETINQSNVNTDLISIGN